MPYTRVQTVKQRILVPLAIIFAAAALGTLAGSFLGRGITLRRAESRLKQYATHILNEAETSAGESRTVLAAMNASPYSFCSDAEIAYFRKLIFRSVYLKEGGRMQGGAIACSADLGRLSDTRVPIEPDFTRQDGTRVYKNLAPFQISGQTVISVQLGDSFIVYSPYNVRGLDSPPMHFTVTDLDCLNQKTVRLLGGFPQITGSILTTEGQEQVGNALYTTLCSSRYHSCITAYISVSDAVRASRSEILLFGASGGLVGAFFGVFGCLFYRRNRSMVQQLRRAIRKDKLHVLYQPIVNLANGRIVGAEALVRWTDEDGYAVGPDVFVKLAEARGFVGEITRLVLRRALQDFAKTLRSLPGFRLSINVSAADLADPEFLPMLEQSLEQARVPARSLAIEITETSTARYEVARETILSLRKRGHSVHIDDFGTGYSSLSYLHDLSVDAIKIDKSFTQAIGTDSVALAILPQMLAMVEALNLEVIVEGVETSLQARYFADAARPILAQGWLFGRPSPPEVFHRSLAESMHASSALLTGTEIHSPGRSASSDNSLDEKMPSPRQPLVDGLFFS